MADETDVTMVVESVGVKVEQWVVVTDASMAAHSVDCLVVVMAVRLAVVTAAHSAEHWADSSGGIGVVTMVASLAAS